MPRVFDARRLFSKLPRPSELLRDPRVIVRFFLGLLLLANLAAAVFVFHPWGGSPEQLEQQLADLRSQVRQAQTNLDRAKTITSKIETARVQGDRFITDHFLDRRALHSTLLAELSKAAQAAGIKPRDQQIVEEPVEGSDSMAMLSINGNYEGTYADLVEFVNLVDRSPRLLIIESLQAAPQQSQGMLNVNVKMNVFVREPQRS
jgi:type IV pilus assembly protein PilO